MKAYHLALGAIILLLFALWVIVSMLVPAM